MDLDKATFVRVNTVRLMVMAKTEATIVGVRIGLCILDSRHLG